MFEAMKHGLWCGESLPFAVRKLVFHKMKNKELRVKNHVLQILTSLSSLFPDKFLSSSLTIKHPLFFAETTSVYLSYCSIEIRKFNKICLSLHYYGKETDKREIN
jgi:hypothetical protein